MVTVSKAVLYIIVINFILSYTLIIDADYNTIINVICIYTI